MIGREQRRLGQQDLERMNIPREHWKVTMEGIKPHGVPHAAIVRQYIEAMPGIVEDGAGLFLFGPRSRGKSGAACVALMAAARWGFSGLFVRASKLCEGHRAGEMYDESHTLLRRAELVDTLVLDDLAKERSEDVKWHRQIITDLIRDRSESKGATIITTNLNGKAGIEKIYTPSLAEVLSAMARAVEVKGHNYRKEQASALKRRLPGVRGQ